MCISNFSEEMIIELRLIGQLEANEVSPARVMVRIRSQEEVR